MASASAADFLRHRTRDTVIVVAVAAIFFALNVDFRLYGDSAMYADYSLRRTFTDVTLHLGYYLLVIGFHGITGALLGLPMWETTAWLNVVSGALTMGIAYQFAWQLFRDRRTALWTVVIFALSGRIITNATSSEIYMPQVLFVLLSFLLFAREQIVAAALAAAIGVLISPLSVFAYLFFPVYDFQRAGTIRWKTLFRLTGFALLFYSPYLIVYGHELLWGTRGLLVIRDITPLDPAAAARNFPKYLFKHLTTLTLLFIAVPFVAKRHLRYIGLVAAVFVPHIYVICKLTTEDNVFLLNTDFFTAALLAAIAVDLSSRKALAWIAPLLLLGHAGILLASRTIFSMDHYRGYAAEMRGINERYQRGRDATIITDWGTAAAFSFYARDTAATDLLSESSYKRVFDLDNDPDADPKLKAPELFVLDRWEPTPLNRFFSSRKRLREQREINGLKETSERRFNLKCTLVEQKTLRLYQCARQAPTPP